MSARSRSVCAVLASCAVSMQLTLAAFAQNAPRSPQPQRCERSAFGIVVDVGHTSEIPGAISARGETEYDYNLRLAREMVQQLIAAGFASTTLLVTNGDKARGLVQRVSRANHANAQVLLSIHHDAVPEQFLEDWDYEGQPRKFSDRFKGHSLFVSYENAQRNASVVFARMLGQALKDRGLQYAPHYTEPFMGSRRRDLVDKVTGIYRFDALYVLRAAGMPAVLLEAGNIKNRDEELQLAATNHRALLVSSAVEAIGKFCDLRAPKKPERSARR